MATFMDGFFRNRLVQPEKAVKKTTIKPTSAAVSANKKSWSSLARSAVVNGMFGATETISDAGAKPSPATPEAKQSKMLMIAAALAAAVGGYLYFKKK